MSYIDTVLNDYQDKVVAKEMRVPSYGLNTVFRKQTNELPYMSQMLKDEVAKIMGRDVKLPQLKEDTITVAPVESFTIPVNLSDSEIETLTFVTMFAGFATFPETFQNNLVDEDTYKLNKVMEVDKALAKQLETYLDTHLNTYKTQVWDGAAQAGYTFTGNTLQASLDQQEDERFFEFLKEMAGQNNWDEDMLDLASTYGIGYVKAAIASQGPANATNLQNQEGEPVIYKSNRVTLTADKRFTGYLMEPGAVGILPNFKYSFLSGAKVGDAQFGVSGVALPQLGDKVMTFENKVLADASGVSGGANPDAIMSWKEEYGFVYRFCLLNKYNSDRTSRVGSILKIDGAKS